jgi:hypothetical protein
MSSGATECVLESKSTNRGEINDKNHGISIKVITKVSRIQEYILTLWKRVFMIHLLWNITYIRTTNMRWN